MSPDMAQADIASFVEGVAAVGYRVSAAHMAFDVVGLQSAAHPDNRIVHP